MCIIQKTIIYFFFIDYDIAFFFSEISVTFEVFYCIIYSLMLAIIYYVLWNYTKFYTFYL